MPGLTIANKSRYDKNTKELDAEALTTDFAFTTVVKVTKVTTYTGVLIFLAEIYFK